MQDLRNLYNQALTTIGADPAVSDPTASTKVTDILNLWFPVARHAVMTAFHWPCLRSVKRLALAGQRDPALPWSNTDPAPGYLYSYALPADMVQPQYLDDFSRFQLGRVGGERLLFSNNEKAILNYTMDDELPGRWDPSLYRCVLWALAACINMARSGKAALTQKLEEQVQQLISDASTNLANADDVYFDSFPSSYTGTGFNPPLQTSRYFYPTSTFRVEGVS